MGAGGTYPALQVAFAWGVNANTVPAAGDWVDESDYLLALSTKWGSEDEFSQPGAGTLELTLDGSSGRFDPDYSSGPRFGQLKPLTWVRVVGGTTSANQDVFYGQVSLDGFRLSASQFSGAVDVSVTVEDALEQLAHMNLPESVWAVEVAADSPYAWYRLGESSGTVATDSSGNARDGVYEGGATFNSRISLVAGSEDGAIGFDGVNDIARVDAGGLTGSAWTVEAWISHGEVDSNDRVIWEQKSVGGQVTTIALSGTSSPDPGEIFVQQVRTPTTGDILLATSRIDNDQPHHIVVTNDGTNLRIYVDGVLEGTDSSYSLAAPESVSIGYGDAANSSLVIAGSGLFAGTIDEVAFYTSALSAARITAHYNAGTSPWNDDLTSARVTRLLDAVGFPSGLRTVDTGNSTMPAANLAAGDTLAALQEAATAEGGRVYADHRDAGKLRFVDRHERYTYAWSTDSQATFGDASGEIPYTAVDLQDDTIINSVTAQRFGGSEITVDDAASQATYRKRDHSLTGLLTTIDADVANRAQALVAEKKDRRRRPRSVVLEPRADSHPAWVQVFARRVGDRVTVKWRPPYGGGTTYSWAAWIIGIAHEWDQRTAGWRTTFWLEPVPYGGMGTAYWLLGTSALGTDTRVGH